MEFKTLEELQAHNKKIIEESLKKTSSAPINTNGLSYFERITTLSQPHHVFKLDWSSYKSDDFADTFLPKVGGHECKGVRVYDGAEILNRLQKSKRKLLPLTNDNSLISIITSTFPKGVEAGNKTNRVQPSSHEIAAFIEVDENKNADISFKFGDHFKKYLSAKKVSSSSIENQTFKTSNKEIQNYFNNTLSHHKMMEFVFKTIELESSSAYGNTNKGELEALLREKSIESFIYKNKCSNNQVAIQGTIIDGWLELKYIDASSINAITKLNVSDKDSFIAFKKKDVWSISPLAIAEQYTAIPQETIDSYAISEKKCPNIDTPISEDEINHISELITEHISYTELKGNEKELFAINKSILKQLNNPFYDDVNLCVNVTIDDSPPPKPINNNGLDGNNSVKFQNETKYLESSLQKNNKECDITVNFFINKSGKISVTHKASPNYLKEYNNKWDEEIKKRGLDVNIEELRKQVLLDFENEETSKSFSERFLQKTKALFSDKIGGYVEAIQSTQKIAKNVWAEGQINQSTWHSKNEEHKQWPTYVQFEPVIGGATDGVIDEIVGIPMAIKGVYGITTDEKQQEAFKELFTQEGLNTLLDGLKKEAEDVINDPEKGQHFGSKTVVAVAATVLGVGIISKSGKISTVLKQTTDKLKNFANPKATKLLQDLKVSTRNVANEIGLNKWLKNVDEDLVEDVLVKASEEAIDKGKKLTFKQLRAFWKRGNDFNEKVKKLGVYDANEIWLTHPTRVYHKGHKFAGKPRRFRLDSWDNLGDGKIVSRKATTLSEIKPSTFENYLKEIEFKYPEGSKIANSEIGDKLYGKKFLEIPESNKTFKNIEEYKKLAKEKYNVEIIFQPE